MSRTKRFVSILSVFLMTLVFFSSTAQTLNVLAEQKEKAQSLPDDIDFWSDYPHDILAQTIVDRMTDEELLSQILMFGWAGAEPSALLNAWVSDRGLGSVKVFGWNTDDIHQVARSVNSLQQRAAARRFKIPLFVATDQEGGWIRHVKGDTTDTPGNMAIGASGYPIDAYYSGYYINREIKALGINMNFAPTVDIYTNLDSSVIGPRSFGSDPQKVGILGEAFAKGSMDAGVIPTAKHFPGHGDTDVDSHGRLPYIDIDFETLMNRELVPFKYLIASGTLTLQKIFDLSKNKTKDEFRESLDGYIRESIKIKVNYADLSYEKPLEQKRIATLLLLFNVESVRRNGENSQWFPFDKYKFGKREHSFLKTHIIRI